jgi:hypothetical protein
MFCLSAAAAGETGAAIDSGVTGESPAVIIKECVCMQVREELD